VGAALAAARGGLRAVELTFTTPGALEALRELRGRLPGDVLLGAGTVMNARQGLAALEAGAAFLVSPHLGEDVLELCRARGAPYVPGVLTPTEVVRAQVLGAEVVKLFPAGSSRGVPYLKDLLGPFPGLPVLATGGSSRAKFRPTWGRGRWRWAWGPTSSPYRRSRKATGPPSRPPPAGRWPRPASRPGLSRFPAAITVIVFNIPKFRPEYLTLRDVRPSLSSRGGWECLSP